MVNFDIPQVDNVYLGELQTQCAFALSALKACEYALNEKQFNSIAFWYHIQMFLISTANIHKMLYNAKDSKYKKHHRVLMEKYNFPKFNFETEKMVRNSFEHYDERIVDWINSSKLHNLMTNNVMPKYSDADEMDVFKNFDPVNNTLSFGDVEFNVVSTFEKINQLNQHIQGILEP